MVVGGGSAGCALAGRLAAAGARRVLLLEAGPAGWTPEILDVASLAATVPGHPANWAHPVELRTGSSAHVPRGRVLGGSGAVNGAVWMRATPADATRACPAGPGRTCWRATSVPRPTRTSATVPATVGTVRCRSAGPRAPCATRPRSGS